MLILAADLHMGRALRAHNPELRMDSYRALKNMKEVLQQQAQGQPTSHLILAGDVLDANRIDGTGLDAVKDFCLSLQNEGWRIWFVQGNHDLQTGRGDHLVPLLEPLGCVSLHGRTELIDGLQVHGLDYMPAVQYHEALQQVPECDLLVTHVAFQHLLGFEGAYTMRLDQIPPQVGNVFVGDIHTTNITMIHGGKGVCISPGPLHATKMDEPGPHGFFCVQDGNLAAAQFVPIKTRPVLRFDVDEVLTDAEIIAKVTAHAADRPVVQLRYVSSEAMLDRIDALEQQLLPLNPIMISPQVLGRETVEGAVLRRALQDEAFSMLDALPYALDAQEHPDEYKLLETLLATDKPQEELDAYMEGVL